MPAGSRWRRKPGIGSRTPREALLQGRGLAWAAFSAARVSGRGRELRAQRFRARRGGLRRAAAREAGDVFEGDCAFDLLAGKDGLLVPADKDADVFRTRGGVAVGRHGSGFGRKWLNPLAEQEMGRRNRQTA